MLLSHGFIPHNARHQKATLKETDDPKAQLRRGLGVSHCLSLEGAVVLRHSVKSLQPSEMKLGLSFFPRLVSWLLLASPAHHLHSHSRSGEVQLCQPMTPNLPFQVRIELILKYSCSVQSGVSIIHLTPSAHYAALKQPFGCTALCHPHFLLLLGGGRSAACALTPHCLSLLCLLLSQDASL